MTTLTHAELVAAVEKVRITDGDVRMQPGAGYQAWQAAKNAHLDTLAAILNLHKPVDRHSFDGYAGHQCPICRRWPCPTVGVVVDALTRMGAL